MRRTEEFDLLLSVTIGLVRTSDRTEADGETKALIKEALQRMFPEKSEEASKTAADVRVLAERIREKKARILPDCTLCRTPCGRFFDYDPDDFWLAGEEIRELKTRILERTGELNRNGLTEKHWELVCRALFAVGEDYGKDWIGTIAEELEGVLYCPDRQ